MQDQGCGDLVTEHMVSRLPGSAGVGLFRKHMTCCSLHFHLSRQGRIQCRTSSDAGADVKEQCEAESFVG